jgi:hypothetical protein
MIRNSMIRVGTTASRVSASPNRATVCRVVRPGSQYHPKGWELHCRGQFYCMPTTCSRSLYVAVDPGDYALSAAPNLF